MRMRLIIQQLKAQLSIVLFLASTNHLLDLKPWPVNNLAVPK